MVKGKIKILIIEDDPFLLSMYATKFELENFDVFCAEHGRVGYEKAAAERPDVILLDIIMPEMNGFEVLAKLKEDPRTKNTPVILLTNLNQKDDIDKGISLGAVDYLIKAHFMPSEVVSKIKNIIAGNKEK